MKLLTLLLFLLFTACTSTPKIPADENLWLEEIQGQQALAWVEQENQRTLKELESHPNFKRNEREIKRIVTATDRLPSVRQMGAHLYNFWQDDQHVRGLWRRTTLKEYAKKNTRWEVLIDFDKLAKDEKENWVFKGSECLPPEYKRCMMRLSRGGKDASVFREFDIPTQTWVKDGFTISEAKSNLAWIDENRLLVATDNGKDSLTTSGYPRQVREWKRGEPPVQAKLIYESKKDDVGVWPWTVFTSQGNRTFIQRGINFYEDESFELTTDATLKKIDKPDHATQVAWLGGHNIVQLRKPWTTRGQTFRQGSLLSLPSTPHGQPQVIFTPNEKQSISTVTQNKDSLIILYLDSIEGRIARAYPKGDTWVMEKLPFPEKGDFWVYSSDPYGDLLLTSFESFLTPDSVQATHISLDQPAAQIKPKTLKSLPPRFSSRSLKVEQHWAPSKDGTKIPYFLVISKTAKYDGSTPTLLYGYGGFEISETPHYPTVVGKAWLEKGGAYAVANIRGGGEFGPEWHQAALKENRQRAYDDFIAIAEDLIARKITSPAKLAINGGSNGGLLVGATFVQRPDLFKAVVCEVPLLDMLRYNKLLAGASWEGEYGDPEDAKIREAILKYSPYQNLKSEVKYPEVFFMTSTADDRVHPGHARKMVARMKSMKHPYLYYENTEGGHSAAANLLQRVKQATMEYTFLQDRLNIK